MSKLEELIKQFCPDGVEYVEIGSVTDYEQPTNYIVQSTKYDDTYKTPVLTAGQSFILGYTNETAGIYIASKESPVIIFDDFTGAFKWVDFPFKVKSSAMKFILADEVKATLRYIFHVMGFLNFSSSEHKRLWITTYSTFQIPLPPLKVQREIVRILDAFTKLTEELTEELTARRKQYEYYRDKLLSFDDLKRNGGGYSRKIEWETLGEVCLKTNNIKWKEQTGEFDYIDLTSVSRDNGTITIEKKINKENAPSRAQQIVNTDDVLYATTRPTLQRYCIIDKQYNNQICSTGFSVLRPNKEKILPLYLYFIVGSKTFLDYVASNQEGTSYPAISDSKLRQFTFAIPPIETQKQIVGILDKFEMLANSLSQGLPAEIEARKKQYEYYRDLLLDFKAVGGGIELLEKMVRWLPLGEIATITRGGNFQKKDFTSDGVPCIHYGQIYTKYGLYAQETFTYISEAVAKKSKKATTNDIIMAVTSENVEDVCKCVAWLGKEDVAVSGHTAIIHHNQNTKYLSYYFHTQMFFRQKEKYAHGTKVIEVTPNKLAEIVIPLPPLEIQNWIVEILDKFHSLVTDISQGIPAEIEARKKQYEYYRDKLLTFKKLETMV